MFKRSSLAITAVLSLVPTFAHGATYSWRFSPSQAGYWQTARNWTPVGVPGSGDSVFIANGGTSSITQPGKVCGTLFLSNSSADSGTVQMSSGGLTTSSSGEYVGYYGTGTFSQTGGTNIVNGNGSFYLGYGYQSGIAYGPVSLGATQAGGPTYFNGGPSQPGFWSSGNGSYNLGGGGLQAGTEFVGYFGVGV